ncbi:MAG: transposase family protein [Polyangiaceae bacterium]|nr:transposase family protein [Polyangiaceae bacterium]
MLDPETGRKRRLWVLVVTLSFSRLQFVWPTFRQTTEAVCEGLDRAWQFFGAMPASIIPDNTKAMIRRPDALDARLVDAFLDYVQARGLFVDPARVRSPKDKPRVENQVPYVRESWFDGETFTSLDDARASAERWSREVAGARVHGTTRQVPAELFEAVEKPTMKPAPDAPFDVPDWIDKAKVHPDHHIQVAHALYSVPTRYLRRHVRVRADRSTVKIYFGTELIKVHPRKPPGGPLHRRPRLPGREGSLRAPGRRRDPSQGAGQGPSRRSLRGAAPRWTAAVDEDAPGLRPARPLRQVHARPRRGDLPERARIRPR